MTDQRKSSTQEQFGELTCRSVPGPRVVVSLKSLPQYSDDILQEAPLKTLPPLATFSCLYKLGVVELYKVLLLLSLLNVLRFQDLAGFVSFPNLRSLSPTQDMECFNLKEMTTQQIIYAHSRHFPRPKTLQKCEQGKERNFSS